MNKSPSLTIADARGVLDALCSCHGGAIITNRDIEALKLLQGYLQEEDNAICWGVGCTHVAKQLDQNYEYYVKYHKLHELVAGFIEAVQAARDAASARGKGGQQVPYHGDFASAPPSVLGQLKWWADRLQELLKPSKED